eukprot:8923798-Pyramimonas_sp.AAC.1
MPHFAGSVRVWLDGILGLTSLCIAGSGGSRAGSDSLALGSVPRRMRRNCFLRVLLGSTRASDAETTG